VSSTVADLEAALRDVNDPEYPISVVDMGLIRGLALDGRTATVKLTYTSMGCPCKEMIADDVRERLLRLDGVDRVEVEESFEQWRYDHISRPGRDALRALGVG
jgi:metal-sulfur cluster biosynthetic enzyme